MTTEGGGPFEMNPMRHESDRLTASIVAFCRFARSKGLPVGTQQLLTALEAAKAIGILDWQLFEFALQAVLCCSQEEWELFDRLFDEFWNFRRSHAERSSKERKQLATQKPSANFKVLAGLTSVDSASPESEGKMVLGASSQRRLRKLDFSEMPQSDLAALEQLSLRLLQQMSLRLSRRMKINNVAGRVDLRRSIRRNITRGGDPITLAYKGRKPQQKRLVIFLDISGSMNLYSTFLVRFAYALHKHFKRVDTFLFSTSVMEVSDVLRARRLSDALAALSQRTIEWSGGTRIGGSLDEFNRRCGRNVLSRNTTFIILSDGWDTGEPDVLAAELRSVRQRVEKVIWLNPLLGLKEYQPITRGMSAALPYVDVFAPAHNLESLLALERHL
jgi:uncharacterized protein with von Willebrand factor type A (vWA) domain